MPQHYQFDAGRRIWGRTDSSTLPYSDGDETEERLLEVLKNAKDVCSSSPEILSAIRDWPSEYHLSPTRHNLLRPFAFKPDDRILELGCGCGAITRYLGEAGATIAAVEGSRRRAQIAAERCRDLPNVSVYCDNLADFISDEKFDYVTLIGVLEYAQQFVGGEDPVIATLKRARSFLKDGGTLILAIENQLGLKYFNGCAEDHTGIPYYGINDRYGQRSPVTFGQRELDQKLSEADFSRRRFYFPFPDYKLPRLILTPEALDHPCLNVADLLSTMDSRDYTGNPYRAFHENRVWPLLAHNKLVADLSNSFLVFAKNRSDVPQAVESRNWLAASYATERHPGYATETLIVETIGNGLEVAKERLFPRVVPPQYGTQRIAHAPQAGTYHRGRLLLAEFQHKMATTNDAASLCQLIAPWFELLWAKSSEPDNPMAPIPGRYLDCIPRNLIRDESGHLFFFDAEWLSDEPVPLAWVATRGLVDSIRASLTPDCFKGMNIRAIASSLAIACRMNINEADWPLIERMETDFQTQVHGRTVTPSFSKSLEIRPTQETNYHERIRELEAEIKRVKSTVSWQVTKPLRLIANLPRFTRKALKTP